MRNGPERQVPVTRTTRMTRLGCLGDSDDPVARMTRLGQVPRPGAAAGEQALRHGHRQLERRRAKPRDLVPSKCRKRAVWATRVTGCRRAQGPYWGSCSAARRSFRSRPHEALRDSPSTARSVAMIEFLGWEVHGQKEAVTRSSGAKEDVVQKISFKYYKAARK